MPWDQFLGNRPNKPQSPNDVASRPLPKSPVGSSLDGVVPQMIIRSPRVRPGNFLFSDAKRLLQQYPPKNGLQQPQLFFRKVPKSRPCYSFDYLVGPREHRRRHGKTEGFRSLEIDDQFEHGGLHHGQIGWLGALQNPADIDARLAIVVANVAAIAHQSRPA